MRSPDPRTVPGGRLTSRSTWALIGALIALVGALALCLDRGHNGDFYMSLLGGRFISAHGVVNHDPFPTIAHGGTWLNQQWLSELAFFRVEGSLGQTGVTILYAVLLAAPLALLLWLCRQKGAVMLIAITVVYFPGVLAIVHPRAAGFTVLAFSALVALIAAAWRVRGAERRGRGMVLAVIAILALFALWANLHGGFVAGLLLIALVTVGLAIDHRRGIPETASPRRVAILGLIGVLAAATVSLATPLGGAIWSYLLSFQNSAIDHASQEWRSALSDPPAMVYVGVVAAFAILTWIRSPRPRRATALLVSVGFVAFAIISLRNIIFVAPALAFQIAWSAPDRAMQTLRLPIAVAGSAAAAAVLFWAAVLGPAQADTYLRSPVVDYALAHPPKNGKIVTYAGVGSYMLWRSPRAPVVINGWLEHFTPQQLTDTYGVLRGYTPDLLGAVNRLQIGAVIAHVPAAIRRLEAAGFEPRFTAPDGTYLVRERSKPN
ncbi:MAG: hypothetical protein ACJ75Z_14620 [Solirubrobacterales bacterium]